MLDSTSAQAIFEIVIVTIDRSKESVPSSVELLARSYDRTVTQGLVQGPPSHVAGTRHQGRTDEQVARGGRRKFSGGVRGKALTRC
jgi:hypothetical protein